MSERERSDEEDFFRNAIFKKFAPGFTRVACYEGVDGTRLSYAMTLIVKPVASIETDLQDTCTQMKRHFSLPRRQTDTCTPLQPAAQPRLHPRVDANTYAAGYTCTERPR